MKNENVWCLCELTFFSSKARLPLTPENLEKSSKLILDLGSEGICYRNKHKTEF